MYNSITKYIDMDLRRALYGDEACYVDPVVIRMCLVDDLKNKMNYDEMKEFIKNASIKLKDSEIKKYLEDKMEKEHPGLRKKLNDERNYLEDEQSHIAKVQDQNVASLYYYEPYSLHYYKKYVLILKQKLLELCKLIDELNYLEDRDTFLSIRKKLSQYDLRINERNELHYLDVIRIEEAFIYNFNDLYKKIEQGNNLETYYKFKLSKTKLLKECIFESNIYPKKEIQINDLKYSCDKQFIALSPNQEKRLIDKTRNNWLIDETLNEIDYNHVLRRTK